MNKKELQAEMILHGISKKEMAIKLGVCLLTLTKKMNGITEFTQGEISKIRDILGLTKDDVMRIFFSC